MTITAKIKNREPKGQCEICSGHYDQIWTYNDTKFCSACLLMDLIDTIRLLSRDLDTALSKGHTILERTIAEFQREAYEMGRDLSASQESLKNANRNYEILLDEFQSWVKAKSDTQKNM